MSKKPALIIGEDGLIHSKNKHACILGTASSTVSQAPIGDYSVDFFTLGWRMDSKRNDVMFDCHRIDHERMGLPENYYEWLANQKVPVYLQEKHIDVPNSHRLPIEKLVNKFGNYFASSIAYMIAIAVLSGYETISLYGIDLRDDSEYAYQRPNAEYLLGFAAGMGVNVVIPNGAALLKYSHRYGYDNPPDYGSLSEEFLQSKMTKYGTMFEEHSKHAIAADGAKQAVMEIMGAFHNAKKGVKSND